MLRADDHAGINSFDEDSVSTDTRHPPVVPTPASSSTAASKARAPAKRAKASTTSSNSSMSPGVLAAAAAAAAAENNINDDGFFDDENDNAAETSAAAVERANNNNSSAMTKEEAALADRRRRNRETQRAIRKKKAARLQDAEVRATVFETEIEKLKLRLREVELERATLQRELDDWKSGRLQLASTAAAAAVTSGAATASSGTPAGAPPRPLSAAARHADSYAPHHHQERHMEVDYHYSHPPPPPAFDERGFSPQGGLYHGYGPPRHHPHPHHAHPHHGHHYYDMHTRPGYDPAYHNHYGPRYPPYDGAAAPPPPPLSAGSSQPAARYADHPAGHQHHAHRHRDSSFSGMRDINDHSVLGKRKSVDQHSPNLPPPPPPAAALGPDIAVRSPSAMQSPSVLQPLSDVAAIHSASPASYSQELHDVSHDKAADVDTTHLSALETAGSNEDGSGGSNPSPSSAGTIRPGYSTAFGHPTALGEAVAAARNLEPRSNSMASSSASASVSDASGSKRPSYDDYHDFWTSSASQSQSDSHTSLSSYSRTTSSMQERDRPHASAAGLGPPKEGGSNTLSDGMILSMSRSSLCASPLSMAHASPTGDQDELADAEGRAARLAAQAEENRNSPSLAPRVPMLPSLAASLEPMQRDKERPVSLPPLSSVVPVATSSYPASPRSLQSVSLRNVTSPALAQTALPVQSSPLRGEEERPRYAYPSKPLLTTRNGSGKSTSYPVVGNETIFEGQEASHSAADLQTQHGRAGSQGQPFHWPSNVHERYYERTQGPPERKSVVNPYGELAPLPASTSVQAAMKPPVSSTRREPDASPPPNISPPNKDSTPVDGTNEVGPVTAASDDSTVAPAEDKTLNRGNHPEVDSSTTGHTERGKPQRRKSTYEDFVELFGSQNAPVLD